MSVLECLVRMCVTALERSCNLFLSKSSFSLVFYFQSKGTARKVPFLKDVQITSSLSHAFILDSFSKHFDFH